MSRGYAKQRMLIGLIVVLGSWSFEIMGAAPSMSASKADALQTDVDGDGNFDTGDTIRYTVVIGNTGDAVATTVTFSDTPDSNTTLSVGTVTTTQGTVTTGNSAGNTTVAVNVGSVAINGSVTITFDVVINKPLPSGTVIINNQGSVSGGNFTTLNTSDPAIGVAGLATQTILDPNLPPQILEGPTATPNPVGTNQDIAFEVTAIDQDSSPSPMTFTWNFGDGTTTTGNPTNHQYTAAGTYTVFVDVFDGSDTTRSDSILVVVGEQFAWENLWVRLHFFKDGRDRMILRGRLPLPAGFNPAGEDVELNLGGVIATGTLRFGGGGLTVPGVLRAHYKLHKRKESDGTRLFRVFMTQGKIQDRLEDEGLENRDAKDEEKSIQVTLTFNGSIISGPLVGDYNSRGNDFGKFSMRNRTLK